MTERRPIDLGTTIAGIRFPLCAMNAAGTCSSTAGQLPALAGSATGASATVLVAVKLPERIGIPYRTLAAAVGEVSIRVVVAHNDFVGLEKLRMEAGAGLELIAVGGIQSGYDVARALSKGARAVQVGAALVAEGPGIFARLAHEMRVARGERGE